MDTAKNEVNGKKSFRLLFHIGAGKTGTSSIQEALTNSQNELREKGVWYLGLMLESAPVKLFDWQNASSTRKFLALQVNDASNQVKEVLQRSVDLAIAEGCHTAIWSNEWFFGRHQAALPALKSLELNGIVPYIVAYVRRHDAWARSAYVQWGIKHKTYSGKIIPFRDYIRKRPVRFSGTLKPWLDAFPNRTFLRNFDEVGDVVLDFIRFFGLPDDILKTVRTNESPSLEELFIRGLFNNSKKEETLPFEFDRLVGTKNIDFDLDPVVWIKSLLPTEADLIDVMDDAIEDRNIIDSILTSQGQSTIAKGLLKLKPIELEPNKMISAMFQVMIHQSQRIQSLQEEINDLKRETKEIV